MQKKERNWTFTINNFTKSDEFSVEILMKRAAYGVCGREVGDEGTPHLQGYVRLKDAITLASIKKQLPRAHLEVAGGNDKQNFDYCSKQSTEENPVKQWGVMSEGQGARTDIREIASKIKNHEITMIDLMFDYPDMYVKYSRSFEKMFAAVVKPRSHPPEVHWRWGLAGVGKTRWVYDTYEMGDIYPKDNTPWWDGYRQQKVILIDDFDNQIPFRTLLRILDRYEYQGQVKCGYVQINSPIIIITCEHPPHTYWVGNEYEQVFRRLASISEIKK